MLCDAAQCGLVLCSGVSKPVDVASANGKAFLNMATGGFGTEAAKKTDSGLKDKVGGAAYAITGELCSQKKLGGRRGGEEQEGLGGTGLRSGGGGKTRLIWCWSPNC